MQHTTNHLHVTTYTHLCWITHQVIPQKTSFLVHFFGNEWIHIFQYISQLGPPQPHLLFPGHIECTFSTQHVVCWDQNYTSTLKMCIDDGAGTQYTYKAPTQPHLQQPPANAYLCTCAANVCKGCTRIPWHEYFIKVGKKQPCCTSQGCKGCSEG